MLTMFMMPMALFLPHFLLEHNASTAILPQTGYSFGYAFVDFASELDAQNAIKSLNGVTVRNKRLKVSYNSFILLFTVVMLFSFFFVRTTHNVGSFLKPYYVFSFLLLL